MKLPGQAIKNHQFTLIIIALLTLLGILSFQTMPRSEDPQFDFPLVIITVSYPGTSPLDMEKLVTDPIEEEINELEDIKNVETIIMDGVTIVEIEFDYGVAPDDKYDDVVQAMAKVRPELPSEIHSVDIKQASPTDVNVLQVALLSDTASYRELRYQAARLEKGFTRVAGVKRAEALAYPDQQVQIVADIAIMRELGLGLPAFKSSLMGAAANVPGGFIDAGKKRFSVKTSGDYQSLDEIRRTVIKLPDGKVVHVENVAKVALVDAEPSYLGLYNGKRSVFIVVEQREKTNIFTVLESLKEVLDNYNKGLPENIKTEIIFDQSVSVARQVNGFFINLLQGLVLVGLIIFLALGMRSASIVLLVIPISMLIGIGGLDFLGFGLQQMSIVGLVIALGLLVDNAIVVTESIGQKLKAGQQSVDAATNGTAQVAWAIASGTATTILAFFPMLMTPNSTGSFMRSMPVTVVLVLVASFFIAITLTPLMASRIFKPVLSVQASGGRNFIQGLLESLSHKYYRSALDSALKHPGWVITISMILFVGSLSLFQKVGVSLFPKSEKPLLLMDIELPESSSFYATQELATGIDMQVRSYPQVRSVAVNIGRENPSVYYNEFPNGEAANKAQLFIILNELSRAEVNQLVSNFRDDFSQTAGAKISVKEFRQGPPVNAPIVIRVLGDDISLLQQAAAEVEQLVLRTQGTVNVDNPMGRPKLDLKINIQRDKAALLNVSLGSIDDLVRTSLMGSGIGRYRDQNGDDYDIMIRIDSARTPNIDNIKELLVLSDDGVYVPLQQLVSIELQSVPSQLQHYYLERSASITSDTLPSFLTADVMAQIMVELEKLQLPPNISYRIGGEQKSRDDSFSGLLQALLISLLGIFAVLVLQFRSFVQPAIVFASIPFAFSGAILALLAFGYSFSVMAFVGLTSLMGIVVNNSIILVDSANQLVEKGAEIREAIASAARTRLTPIVLTTLTTIVGLLPLTMQNSSMWTPLGLVIIGGMLISTVVTLFIVPALFLLITPGSISAKPASGYSIE
ncbi:MAG: efflux RND transporter permease subunit [Pseudomonadales bacterium]|nr:efflux RND transporter permease subunit [Pseudomonadales bacterium]